MITNVSRRGFLKTIGVQSGAFVLGAPMLNLANADEKQVVDFALGVFVSIAPSGDVTIINHRAEMGQGIMTSVPQIIADELGADWSRVTVIQAQGDAKYGNQGTGGSGSIRHHFPYLRQMGAVARDMLETAAAELWHVNKVDVVAQNHQVINLKTKQTLGFGELAERASNLAVPNAEKIKLKKVADFSLIGKDVKLAGQKKIVMGQAIYAQDIQLPNMLIASIQRPPIVGGRVKSFDATEAKKVAGVVDIVQLKDRSLPVNVKPVSGVAVLATNTWAAQEARKKLVIQWDFPDQRAAENAKHNSVNYLKDLVEKVNGKGIQVRNEGDVYGHEYAEENTVEATYTIPYHHHMSMETPAATADVKNNKCRVWTGTQNPQWAKGLIAEELGIDQANIEVNMTLMGGAFGRKGKNDFTLEAVELSKAVGRPVKVVWTREDDVKHGYYHSISANYCKAELTANGGADYWLQRVAYPPIGATFDINAKSPSSGQMSLGFADIPFDLQHLRCEKHDVETHVRIGWFRSVANINNAFALGCFVDELAAKAKVTTQKMWLTLIGSDRLVDIKTEGFSEWDNYGQTSKDYALNTQRMKHVINEVVQKAGADKKLPANEGWGISYAHSFNAYVAAATKVAVVDKKLTVLEMHTVIDCGIAVTPDRVKSQMEGAMIMGLSTALLGGISVKDGVVEQNNFYDYATARMDQVPPLFVHIIESNEAPGGVGEPGLPPVLPSIVNAIYHASGIRIRDLPVNKVLTV